VGGARVVDEGAVKETTGGLEMLTNYPARIELADRQHGEGGERMTEVQAVKLRELSEALGEPFDSVLTRRQAAARIRDLQRKLR
jgi:hypothetical protein